MKKTAKIFFLSLLCLVLQTSFVWADSELGSVDGEDCGLYVRATDADTISDILAFASWGEPSLKINFRDHEEILQSSAIRNILVDDYSKPGSQLTQIYKNEDVAVQLKLKSIGMCGDAPKYKNSDECEYVAFTGTLTTKTPQGEKTYKVAAENGC